MPRSRRLSDATLVRRSQQGDRRAFTALLTRYDWRLRGLAHALLLDPAEMDAALGAGYLRAWRDVVRINPSDNVAAWLYRVVYNACIDQLRLADGARSQATAPPAAGVATGLAALPASERVVVVLVDREGFSPTSAARIMGLSPDAVTATLDRARATLAEHVPAGAPAAAVPDPPADGGAVPAPATDPTPVDGDVGHADPPPVAGAAAEADSPSADGAAVGGGTPVAGSGTAGDTAAVDHSEAVGGKLPDTGAVDTAAVDTGAVDTAAVDTGAVDTAAVDTGAVDIAAVDDTDGFEDRGPIDHEAVAAAVVAEPPVDDGDPSGTREAPGAGGIAEEPDGAPAPSRDSGGPQVEPQGSDAFPGELHDSDGASANGNGSAAAGPNGHASNSGRGRRARRRAKHAAARQRPDGTGPAGAGNA